MVGTMRALAVLVVLLLIIAPCHAAKDDDATTVVDLSKEWEEAPLYNRNKAYCKIQSAMAPFLIEGWVVVQDGQIQAEGYDADRKKSDVYEAWSVTKSWSTMLIGKMVELGQLVTWDTLGDIFDEDTDWVGVNQATEKQRVTLYEILTMTSGLVTGSQGFREQETLQEVLNFMTYQSDQRGQFNYLGSSHILSRIILRRSGLTPREFAEDYRIFRKLGIENRDFEWEQFGGVEGTAYGLSTTPRVFAKLGQLYLQNGLAAPDEQLIPAQWVEDSTTDQLSPDTESVQCLLPGYGYQWYVDRKEREGLLVPIPAVEGAFAANGVNGQQIIVIPKSRTVIAIMSDDETQVYNYAFSVVILQSLNLLDNEAGDDYDCGQFSLSSFVLQTSMGMALSLMKLLSILIFE